MRIELTRVGLLVYLANHYTTRGAPRAPGSFLLDLVLDYTPLDHPEKLIR